MDEQFVNDEDYTFTEMIQSFNNGMIKFRNKYGLIVQVVLLLFFFYLVYFTVDLVEAQKSDPLGTCEKYSYCYNSTQIQCYIYKKCEHYKNQTPCETNPCGFNLRQPGDNLTFDETSGLIFTETNPRCEWIDNSCHRVSDTKNFSLEI